jgi:hypothetical protein
MFGSLPANAREALIQFQAGNNIHNLPIVPLPQGYWANPEITRAELTLCLVPPLSRRLKLSTATWPLTRLIFQKSLPWPISLDVPQVLRSHNGTWLIWCKKQFLQIPYDKEAERRFEQSTQAQESLKTVALQHVLAQSQTLNTPRLHRRSERLFLANSAADRKELNLFIGRYFKIVMPRGIAHGDFHINNIFKSFDNQYRIVDWDMMDLKGMPLADIISFAVHYLGFFIFNSYGDALQLLKRDAKSLLKALAAEGFDFWLPYASDLTQPGVTKSFFKQRLLWFEKNDADADFREALKKMAREWGVT